MNVISTQCIKKPLNNVGAGKTLQQLHKTAFKGSWNSRFSPPGKQFAVTILLQNTG